MAFGGISGETNPAMIYNYLNFVETQLNQNTHGKRKRSQCYAADQAVA